MSRAERSALAARLTVVEGRLRFLEAGDPGGALAIRGGLLSGAEGPATGGPAARGQPHAAPLALGFSVGLPADAADDPGAAAAAAVRAAAGNWDASVAATGAGLKLAGQTVAGDPSQVPDTAARHQQVAELRIEGKAIPRPAAAGAPPTTGSRLELPAAAVPPVADAAPQQPPPTAAVSAASAGGTGPGLVGPGSVLGVTGTEPAGGSSRGGGSFGSTEELIRALQSRYQEASAFLAQERCAQPCQAA